MAKKSFCTFQCFLTIRLFLALFKLENDVDTADDDKWHCFTITHFANQSAHTSMKKRRYICVVIFSIQFRNSYQSVLSAFSPSIFNVIAVEINLKNECQIYLTHQQLPSRATLSLLRFSSTAVEPKLD